MGRTIAIWGSPESGKTTFTVKLARAIYELADASIICIHTNDQTPDLPVLFPHCKREELPSVGELLSKTEITTNEVLSHLVSPGKMKYLGFLGYTDGDNRFSYPEFMPEKAKALMDTAATIADVVIVDCSHSLSWPLNQAAIQNADGIIRLCSPTLKSVSFFASQLPLYDSLLTKPEACITGLVENWPFAPMKDAVHHFQDAGFVVPFCETLRQQMTNGDILSPVQDKKWNGVMNAVARMAVTGN